MKNVIRDNHDGLMRLFDRALREAAQCLDERNAEGLEPIDQTPLFVAQVVFRFEDGSVIATAPAHDLHDPIPDPIPTTATVVAHGVE